jgi:hypothetical protein
MDAGTQGTGDAALRTVRASERQDINGRYQSRTTRWATGTSKGTDLTEGAMALRGACQATRLEVIASTEVPKEDISALRDVEGVRQCGHYVMGGLLGQQKVSYGWVAGTAGDSSANS